MDLDSFLVLLEKFFPVLGVVIIVILAGMTAGKEKWAVLIIGPAILLGLQFLLIKSGWIDGNMLTIAILGLFIMAAYYYYIILLILGLAKLWKHYKSKETP